MITQKNVSVIVPSTDLKLINSPFTQKERIQARIDAFRRDIIAGDGSVDYIEDILQAIHEYLWLYEDELIVMGTFKLRECIYYIQDFKNS